RCDRIGASDLRRRSDRGGRFALSCRRNEEYLGKLNYVQTGFDTTRRKRVEQGKSFYGLERRQSFRKRNGRGTCRRQAFERRRLHVRRSLHIGAETRDTHALAYPG